MTHSDFLKLLQSDAELNKIRLNIRTCLSKYITDYKLNSLVLGISGGIDSALCAALVKPVCEQFNIPLIGRSITIESNKKEEVERSLKIENFFARFPTP
jgi:NH3-dependent NAD+ synthetase